MALSERRRDSAMSDLCEAARSPRKRPHSRRCQSRCFMASILENARPAPECSKVSDKYLTLC